MSLLNELMEQNLIEENILENLGNLFHQATGMESLRQLERQQLVDETPLMPFFSHRYHVPLLSEAPSAPLPFSDSLLTHHIYQETKILLVVFGEQTGGLLSIHSDLFSLDKINHHFEAPLLWHWSTSQQIESLRQVSEQAEAVHANMSVVELTHYVLEQAITRRCSDVHFEAGEHKMTVRFRLDGHLYDAMELPADIQASVFSRLKILAGMDVAVKRRPQDGYHRFQAKNGERFDLRVASVPTEWGEKFVIRLLNQTPVQYKLEALGFFAEDLELLYRACRMQSGLILVVGPTGSGKTTTLYSMLNEINSRTKNIMTVEDPVEYHLTSINQVSVQSEHNLTFAQTLRAFLRQDPDVILVGEIRDEETADIAIKAALTGHLVLSTLHSADAVTTIQRLGDLGTDLNLLADTLKVVLSQRLVRRVCSHSQEEEKLNCPRCRGIGYSGRVPIYEILQVNRAINARIKARQLGEEMVAPGNGVRFHSFAQTAQRLIAKGITDSQEVATILSDF